MAHLLGIDLSTQSCSGILIDTETGGILSEKSVQFGKDLPQYKSPQGFLPESQCEGEVHSDPLMWLDALDLLFARWVEDGIDLSKIDAVSGAGQQHGTVYLNESWNEVLCGLDATNDLASQIAPALSRKTSPIWMDGSTSEECREIATAVGGNQTVCELSGSIAIERFSGPQIRRFFKTDPNGYAKTHRIHLVSSFLGSVLSGSDSPIDQGDGAGMNLLNLHTWDWDEKLLTATAPGLKSKLTQVVPSRTIIGTLHTYWQKKYGFRDDVTVVACTGDNPSSLIGMGGAQPGKVVISLGTSDTFFAAMPTIQTDPDGFGHVFGNPAGGAMTLQCFRNGSLAREKIRDQLGWDWDRFDQAILQNSKPGNGGRWMLPFFEPEITPRCESHEPIFSENGAIDPIEEADAYARACVEGQLLNMWRHSDWMQLDTTEILLTGGGSRSKGIARIAADVFQGVVRRLSVTGSVGLGAALRAGQTGLQMDLNALEKQFCQPDAEGAIQPNSDLASTYRDLANTLPN